MPFLITRDRPEDAPARLAVQLAEALQAAADGDLDAASFRAQAAHELRKTKVIKDAIVAAKEFRRHPPARVSRMEPAATYDLRALKAQLDETLVRLGEFTRTADAMAEAARSARASAAALQLRLRHAHA